MKKPTPIVSTEEFRSHAKDNPAFAEEVVVRAPEIETEIKAGEEERTVQFTISTPDVDRMGDSIAVEGWKLDHFRKNPQVLFNHDASTTVGVADKVWVEDGKLKALASFQPPEISRFADAVYRMLIHPKRFLRASSVGFMPLKYAFTDDPQRRYGIDFIEQELLEFSVCSIPANPNCLVDAKAAGIDVAPVAEWCEAALKKLGKAIITTERMAAIERAATNARLAYKRNRELDLIRARAR